MTHEIYMQKLALRITLCIFRSQWQVGE